MLIVQKYGGTSLGDGARLGKAARRAAELSRQGHGVVVVVSAQGGSTDEMISMANDCLIRIRKNSLEKRYEELSQEISSASGDQLSALLQEAREISDKLKKLK